MGLTTPSNVDNDGAWRAESSVELRDLKRSDCVQQVYRIWNILDVDLEADAIIDYGSIRIGMELTGFKPESFGCETPWQVLEQSGIVDVYWQYAWARTQSPKFKLRLELICSSGEHSGSSDAQSSEDNAEEMACGCGCVPDSQQEIEPPVADYRDRLVQALRDLPIPNDSEELADGAISHSQQDLELNATEELRQSTERALRNLCGR